LLDIRIVRRRRELIRVQGIRSNRSNQRSISSNQTNQPISDPTTRTSLAETNLSESPLLGIRSVRNRRTDTSNVTNQESTSDPPTNNSLLAQTNRSDLPTCPPLPVRRSRRNQRDNTPNVSLPISDPTTGTPLSETNLSDSPSLGIRSRRNRRTNTSNVTNQESTSDPPTNNSSLSQRRSSRRRNQSTDPPTTQISNSLLETAVAARRTSSTFQTTVHNELPFVSNTIFRDETFYVGERINVMCGYEFDQSYTATILSINYENRTANIKFDVGSRQVYTRSFIHMSHIDLNAGRPVRTNRLQIDHFSFETYDTNTRTRITMNTSDPITNVVAPNLDAMDYNDTLNFFGDGSENRSSRRMLLSSSYFDPYSSVIRNVSQEISSDSRMCSICQTEDWAPGDKRTVLPCCGAAWHSHCIVYYLTKYSSCCPHCRFNVAEVED